MVQLRWWIAALLAAGCGDHANKQPTLIDASVTHDDATIDGPPDASVPVNVLDTAFATQGKYALGTGVACVAFALDTSDRPILVSAGPSLPATLTRFTSAGVLDPTFGAGGSVYVANGAMLNGWTSAFTLASGKIVVLATFPIDATHYAPHLYRFTDAGVPDLDVELPITVSSAALIARERADGDLEVVTTGTAAGRAFAIVRITAAGVLDATFGDHGVAVLDTSAYGMSPGYFPHGVAVGDGTFVLSGASFGSVGMGTGPINGHLIRVVDGAITAHAETDNAQVFSLALDGTQPIAFVNAFPDNHGTIEPIDATTLAPDLANTLAMPFTLEGRYGMFSGAALAVGSGTDLIVGEVASGAMMLARYASDASHASHARSEVTGADGYCGSAIDSHDRPVFATQNAIYRFVP